jgi:hypothetical protein
MRRANSVFSPQERKAAVWALLMAAAVASMGVFADRWSQPSVGPNGAAAYAYAPAAGVLDARPADLAG